MSQRPAFPGTAQGALPYRAYCEEHPITVRYHHSRKQSFFGIRQPLLASVNMFIDTIQWCYLR